MKRPREHAARCPGPESEQVTHQESASCQVLQVQANYTKGTVLHAYLYASSEGQAALEWQAPLSCSCLRLLWAKVSGFPGYAMDHTPEQREPKCEL